MPDPVALLAPKIPKGLRPLLLYLEVLVPPPRGNRIQLCGWEEGQTDIADGKLQKAPEF